ncbi:DUF962 domain-containing protein [Aquabacterium sp. A7-Y]|uniref:Mpo1 family 2-hydroxy fatty acid dioxygenase n=1 Tax=Aquabacterium sp. A7-Y TaxID=1349605 RepID=UPI00223DC40B|nr:Mpo1-like protein [Aquabacterium sp. A7-Y]MCW7538655.1 DUF962 domain-containing protein [Aquabacterium sp. A7-Y]
MKTALEQLSGYAAYHRDTRNIATHFIGVPMIVVAITALLARLQFPTPLGQVSLAALITGVLVLYYLKLDLRLGSAMLAFNGLALVAGSAIAGLATPAWLGLGLGLFVVGWVFQFVGHYFEGRKPAFVDDLMGLLIGPLFVVAEWLFALGLCTELRDAIETRAGKTHGASRGARTA